MEFVREMKMRSPLSVLYLYRVTKAVSYTLTITTCKNKIVVSLGRFRLSMGLFLVWDFFEFGSSNVINRNYTEENKILFIFVFLSKLKNTLERLNDIYLFPFF